MARLPVPGSDENTWGDILNEFLAVEHANDGTLKKSDNITDATTKANDALEQISSHTSNTSNPHTVTKSQVGLQNVTNDTQLKASDLDTDATMAANSDDKLASQKATKTYADTKVEKSSYSNKGSILAASAAGIPQNLDSGNNGEVLQVDSSQQTGLKWSSLPSQITDWSSSADYGSAITLDGLNNSVQRYDGVLTTNCTITINLSNNQQLELALHQNSGGGHNVSWVGVMLWATLDGNPPNISTTPEATERFYFERVNGIVYGYHITESVAPAVHSHAYLGAMSYSPGYYYGPHGRRNPLTLVSGRMYMVPWYLTSRQAFSAMAVHVTTLAAGSTIRLGIYTDNGSNAPGTLLIEPTSATPIDSTGTGVKTSSMAITLEPAVYWLVCVAQGGTPAVAGITDDSVGLGFSGSATSFSVSPSSYYKAGIAATLPPSNPTVEGFSASSPAIMLKVQV